SKAELPGVRRGISSTEESLSLRTSAWKLLDGSLYDLKSDPGERAPVENADRRRELGALREELIAQRGAGRGDEATHDDALRAQLQSLGYVAARAGRTGGS